MRRWIRGLAMLAFGLTFLMDPSYVSAQRYGVGLIDIAGRVGTGGVALGLIREENFMPERLMEEGAFGLFEPSLGVRVDQTTFSVSTSLHLNNRSELISAGASVTYTFLEERLTPIGRVGASWIVHLPEFGGETGAEVSASGIRAELSAGLRWYLDSRTRTPSWIGADFYLQFDLVGAYLHLDRRGENECAAPCFDEGVELARGGSGDGMSLLGVISFGYVTGG